MSEPTMFIVPGVRKFTDLPWPTQRRLRNKAIVAKRRAGERAAAERVAARRAEVMRDEAAKRRKVDVVLLPRDVESGWTVERARADWSAWRSHKARTGESLVEAREGYCVYERGRSRSSRDRLR